MYFWKLETLDCHANRAYFYFTTKRVCRNINDGIQAAPERIRLAIDNGEYSPIMLRHVSPLTYIFRKTS